jgi:hypothetical protein
MGFVKFSSEQKFTRRMCPWRHPVRLRPKQPPHRLRLRRLWWLGAGFPQFEQDHLPDRLHEEVSADYNDMIYAASKPEIPQMTAEMPRRRR